MRKKRGWILLATGWVLSLGAMTPHELHTAIESGQAVTLIDLRPQAEYNAGSIPNALRMSSREALEKPLSGLVVFFDSGTGPDRARGAADALAASGRPGIQARALQGGFAGWRDMRGTVRESSGLRPMPVPYVTYQHLTGPMIEDADDIVLLDVRSEPLRPAVDRSMPVPMGAVDELLDLASALPGYRVMRGRPNALGTTAGGIRPMGSAFSPVPSSGILPGQPPPLYVLVDAGDGEAEKIARELIASGITRIAVLAGGETIIQRQGIPGSIRRGPGSGLAPDPDTGLPGRTGWMDEEDAP